VERVYFNDRAVSFEEDFPGAFRQPCGLSYSVVDTGKLDHIVEKIHRWVHIPAFHLIHSPASKLTEAFRACFTIIRAGGGLVFNERNEFLVIWRNEKWDLPKGKCEPGESFESTAEREVLEETGLEGLIRIESLLSTYHTYLAKGTRILKETLWFEFQYRGHADPVPEEKEGITGYRWAVKGKTGFIAENTYRSILDVLAFRQLQ
jgi:8-oxo-dGTP pyrophosphatase MutT (NUDIX family)